MKKYFVFLFALVLGCSTAFSVPAQEPSYVQNQPPHGVMKIVAPVWVDVGFDPVQRADIHKAFAEWNKTLNGYEEFQIVSDEFDMEPSIIHQIETTGQGVLVLKHKTTDVMVQMLDDGVLAWVPDYYVGEVHIVSDRIGNRDLVSIVEHEIGHFLGLEHLKMYGNLMYPHYPFGSPCIDKVTAQRVATIHRWDYRHMSYCNIAE